MSRTKTINKNLMMRQTDPLTSSIAIANNTITEGKLSREVANGLIPLGMVFPIMPHIFGSWQPAVSGVVNDGFIRCDGAAIPAGMKVTGSTPDLTANNYLRGSSVSGATGGTNTIALNTPQLPTHDHPLTLGGVNIPHNHGTNVMSNGTASHVHTAADTTSNNIPHSHVSTATATNAPHTHITSNLTGPSIAPHTHPKTISISTNPHSHSTFNNFANIGTPGRHWQYSLYYSPGNPQGSWTDDLNDYSPANPFAQGVNSGSANMPHSHSVPSLATVPGSHSHPVSVPASNAPHSHTTPSGTEAVLHTHTIGATNAGNIPHSHTLTVDSGNAPHDHTMTKIGRAHV